MFHIFGLLFFFILLILLVGFTILWRIVSAFLGLGKRMTGNANPNSQGKQRATYQRTGQQTGYQQYTTGNNRSQSTSESSNSNKQKVFDDDEGEYVEFEEIKD